MGRIRRLRKAGVDLESVIQLIELENCNESLYRFFPEKWQAQALVDGKIWLSTLETCRNYENPAQGDSGEATEIFLSGTHLGGGDDPTFVEIARRSGIQVGSSVNNVLLENNFFFEYAKDAYLFCTSKVSTPETLLDFGDYCVEITNPRLFAYLATKRITEMMKLSAAVTRHIIYGARVYMDLDTPSGLMGFVKPREYESQKEFRFLWEPIWPNRLAPFLLSCPELKGICRFV